MLGESVVTRGSTCSMLVSQKTNLDLVIVIKQVNKKLVETMPCMAKMEW